MPGGKFQDTVELIIAARDRASATVDKVRKKVREANKGQEQFGGKLIQNALRATAAFGTLELGLGAVNAATKVFSGEWEDAADAVERLPAGIGPFARQLRETLGTVTGIRQQVEQIDAHNANMVAATQLRLRVLTQINEQEEDSSRRLRAMQDEQVVLRAPEGDRTRIQARQALVKTLREQQEIVDALRASQHSSSREEADSMRVLTSARAEAVKHLNELLDTQRRLGTEAAGTLLQSGGDRIRNARRDAAVARNEETTALRIINQRRQEALQQEEDILALLRQNTRQRLIELEVLPRIRSALQGLRDSGDRRAAEDEVVRLREIQEQRAQELRHEQRMLAIEERRKANRKAIIGLIDRGLQSRIDALREQDIGARRAIIGRGSQEITGRFQPGLRDQLSQQRDDPMLEAARQGVRQRDAQIQTLRDAQRSLERIEKKLDRPGFNLLPANLRLGRGF